MCLHDFCDLLLIGEKTFCYFIGTEIGATSPIPTTSSSPPVTNETATVISQISIIGVAVGILVLLLAIVVVFFAYVWPLRKWKLKATTTMMKVMCT